MRNKKLHAASNIAGEPRAAQADLSAASSKDIHQAHNSAGSTEDRLLTVHSKRGELSRSSDDNGLLVAEAAAKLRCNRSTIYRLVRHGILWGWSISANPDNRDGDLRIASESIDIYKRRYFRGGSLAELSTRSSGSRGGLVHPSRRRADASAKKYQESLLSLESAGITFKSRKA